MNAFRKTTEDYERWLRGATNTMPDDFAKKYEAMREDEFAFLRATFYRWVQYLPELPKHLLAVPKVLAVGDLHLENFGTWRDAEGRLAWGINDFDEAHPLPFTADLLRLATSATLAHQTGALEIPPADSAQLILEGYADSLKNGGRPYILDNSTDHAWLRDLAETALAKDELQDGLDKDEKRSKKLKAAPRNIVRASFKAIAPTLPTGMQTSYFRVQRGLGSLGRVRFRARGEWLGGILAREAKALAPSAVLWESNGTQTYVGRCLSHRLRAADPTVRVIQHWAVRGLSRDNIKIEAVKIKKLRRLENLFFAMGWETANVHMGTGNAALSIKLKESLKKLSQKSSGKSWLKDTAETLSAWVKSDYKTWTR